MTKVSSFFSTFLWPFYQIDSLMRFFADWIAFEVLSLDPMSSLGNSVHFFVYDVFKILFLLTFMIFIISLIRSFFPPEKVKGILNRSNGFFKHFLASFLGILSPFCSCSTVPLFIGFVESGIPLGVTFTFLVTSPIVNEIALGFLILTFGWQIALLYTVAGMAVGMSAGFIIDKLHLEHLVISVMTDGTKHTSQGFSMTWKQRIDFALENVKDIVGRVWIFVIIGIGLGALVHGYAPEEFLTTYAGANQPLAVFIAVIVGVPLYANAVGTIPIVEALILKGVSLGTALAFMMSVVALSFPELILLKQVIRPKLIAIFILITSVGILLVGYAFNLVDHFFNVF